MATKRKAKRDGGWLELNDFLRNCRDERVASKRLAEEVRRGRRLTYALRIHAKLNRLRAARERESLRQRLGDG